MLNRNQVLRLDLLVETRDSSHRVGLIISADRTPYIQEAMNPVHTNDSAILGMVDAVASGFAKADSLRIRAARDRAAEIIAKEIADYLVDVEFARSDTHNGYLKSTEPEVGRYENT